MDFFVKGIGFNSQLGDQTKKKFITYPKISKARIIKRDSNKTLLNSLFYVLHMRVAENGSELL